MTPDVEVIGRAPRHGTHTPGGNAGTARPRIGVDARDLLIAQPTGVERMVFHFVDQLAAFDACEFVLFFDGRPPDNLRASTRHEVVIEMRRFGRLRKVFDTWVVFQLPGALKRHRIDAFISLNSKFPFMAGIPSFATVHGVEWFFYPEGYRLWERIKQRAWFELACRYCAGIITFSQNSRRDILHIRPSCRVPLCAVPEGCDAVFRRLSQHEIAPDLVARYDLPAPYILSVCTLVPRKNIDGLLHAFARLVNQHGIPHSLALAGKSGWKARDLRALTGELGISERVFFLGFVPDRDLVQLYNQAALFAYPSKYEGFGLPLLEAMSCGVPVVTSDRSATAEVAGDAAVLVDPFCVADLAQGMLRVLTDDTLRARLVGAGCARVGEYSWTEMARRICEFVLARSTANGAALVAPLGK